MNQRPPAPPFVAHSRDTHRPTATQPPIVVDVQRLVEHMRADFRAEFLTFKAEVLAAISLELQNLSALAPVSTPTTPVFDYAALQRAVSEAMGRASYVKPVSTSTAQEDVPLFVPSDLLIPREGTVEVKTAGEGWGSLDEAAEALKRMKRGKK